MVRLASTRTPRLLEVGSVLRRKTTIGNRWRTGGYLDDGDEADDDLGDDGDDDNSQKNVVTFSPRKRSFDLDDQD